MTARAELRGADDWPGFRQLARRLVQERVAPEQVRWAVAGAAQQGLFDDGPRWTVADEDAEAAAALRSETTALRLPAGFVELARAAALHDDDDRHDFLYRWVWQLAHEPAVWRDNLSEPRLRLTQMAKTVRREMHKMSAFVRFQPARDEQGREQHVAWFEPAHHVVSAMAPFFTRRFTNMRWAIFTPRACAAWDGAQLQLSPGVPRQPVAPDDGQALWLAYYASTFNPARLKLKMMQKEMPKRYWANLPEAQLIAPLAAQSSQRQMAMIEQPASVRTRRRAMAMVAAAPASAPTAAASTLVPVESLDALAAGLQRCTACPLHAAATQAVPGRGPQTARVMLVGEQPGDREDLEGRAFVGPAGQLLQRVLAGQRWADGAYFTNAVKHFKYEFRGKRRLHKTAAQLEVLACGRWLEDEIRLVQPQLIVALGATAAFSLLRETVPVLANEGRWLWRDDGRPVLIARHPAALLRQPDDQRDAALEQWAAALAQAAWPPVSPVSPG